MATEELELDMKMCLRCTIDTKSIPRGTLRHSSEFRLKGNTEWKLIYSPMEFGWHILWLRRSSRVGVYTNPIDTCVMVESSGNGRIVDDPSTTEVKHFPEITGPQKIFSKSEDKIERAVPEFLQDGVLKLLVVLKVGSSSYSKASQTEWSDPNAAGQSSSTRSYQQYQTIPSMNILPCLQSLSKDLDQLMVEGSYHDVEFLCAGHSTKAHKSIVCKRSPVIASMLATDMVEGRTGVVVISDIEPDIFTQFMRYIYSGQLEELTFDTALRLYEAGDQYEVLGLARRCSEILWEHLSVDNAYEVLVVADAHNDQECMEKVIDYMVESRVPLVSEEWSAFCDEHSKLAFKVLNRAFVKAFTKLPAFAASERLVHNPNERSLGTSD